MTALALDTFNLTKRFGAFTALDGVSLAVRPGTVHALLGENGAGKSTLVKCVVGYYKPDGGAVLVDGREQDISSPMVARALGIGMVYQHFTLVPNMTVAENLVLSRAVLPFFIDWKAERAALASFLDAESATPRAAACNHETLEDLGPGGDTPPRVRRPDDRECSGHRAPRAFEVGAVPIGIERPPFALRTQSRGGQHFERSNTQRGRSFASPPQPVGDQLDARGLGVSAGKQSEHEDQAACAVDSEVS